MLKQKQTNPVMGELYPVGATAPAGPSRLYKEFDSASKVRLYRECLQLVSRDYRIACYERVVDSVVSFDQWKESTGSGLNRKVNYNMVDEGVSLCLQEF